MTNHYTEPSKTACLQIVRSAMFGHAIADGWLAGLRKAENIEALCSAFVDSLEENVER